MNVYAERAARVEQLGWTRVINRGYNRCPRRLVRTHCRNWYEYGACWCCSRLNDHGGTWRDNRNQRFVLWEPYGADGEELADVIAAARQDGLRVRVVESVWYPPSTVGIRFDATQRIVPSGVNIAAAIRTSGARQSGHDGPRLPTCVGRLGRRRFRPQRANRVRRTRRLPSMLVRRPSGDDRNGGRFDARTRPAGRPGIRRTPSRGARPDREGRAPRMKVGVVDLMCEILRGAPSLPRALCRSRPELFDLTDESLAGDAIELCQSCPERRLCGEWVQQQRRDTVTGVLAGRVVPHSSTRRPQTDWGR